MKLHKLYSSDTRFHRITFKDGLNIVIGKVSHPREMEKDSHNLGKSTLIDVLDFMLLKAIDKNHILYLNTTSQPLKIKIKGKAKSLLYDAVYNNEFEIKPFPKTSSEIQNSGRTIWSSVATFFSK